MRRDRPDPGDPDDRPRPRRPMPGYANAPGAGSVAFRGVFGGMLGCVAAVALCCFLLVAGCVGLIAVSKKPRTEPTPAESPRRR